MCGKQVFYYYDVEKKALILYNIVVDLCRIIYDFARIIMYISKIEIQYFRSIYREVISDLKSLNIITGKNDIGKSNILKALNLFFNNETEPNTPFVFSDNFNLQRLNEVRKDSIKGKQYIQIKITFNRGSRAERTLPNEFTITKKWFRNDTLPSVIIDDLEKRLKKENKKYNDRSRSSLTSYLNRIRYMYIPAIKDNDTFKFVLTHLKESIYDEKLQRDKQLKTSLLNLSERVSTSADELNREFETATGVKTSLATPKNVMELYHTIGIDTEFDGNTISLDRRGDGIRVRYIPSILNYIAKNSSNSYIWGFEEPENSLEYSLAFEMAKKFQDSYCEKSMIFCTSHSPAFIGLNNDKKTKIYRCYRKEQHTKILAIDKVSGRYDLSKELGYIELQRELFSELNERMSKLKDIEEKQNKLIEELKQMRTPVLYTEGITDVLILEEAWKRLYKTEMPFVIKSCNVLDEEDGSAAGCDILKNLLCSTQPDSPQIAIGLFDRDQEGIKSYQLSNNFDEINGKYKIHRNKRAYALLLPIPPGKEKFAEYQNLCIEFFFEKSDLDKRIDGKGLKLKAVPVKNTFKGKCVEERIPTELHFHEIDKSTKKYFAEKIVPTLPTSSFVHFKLLFDYINEILTNH